MANLLKGTQNWDEKEYYRMLGEQAVANDEQERFEKVRPDIGLKFFRSWKGLSQVEMATVMDVSRRSYIDYEHGEKPVPSVALARLLSKFDCDLNVLFTQHPAPITAAQGAKFTNRAIDLTIELMRLCKGMDKEDARKVVGAIIADESDPACWDEKYIMDYVETYTNYFPSAKERRSWPEYQEPYAEQDGSHEN